MCTCGVPSAMKARSSRSWSQRSAAVKLMRKLLRKQGFAPKRVTTDKLRSYGAAFQHLALCCHRDSERAMLMGGACAKAYGWSPKKD
jgi:hypothetical protein